MSWQDEIGGGEERHATCGVMPVDITCGDGGVASVSGSNRSDADKVPLDANGILLFKSDLRKEAAVLRGIAGDIVGVIHKLIANKYV